MTRTAEPARRTYDLAVIGGGVNGCGIARDAAGRGASVVLIERGDLAQGTSSASTKLIHGGLRYLEHYEFGLVREALHERERLWGIAPHIIRPMRFVLPLVPGIRPAWMIRAGLFLYDHMGGRKRLPATRSLDLADDEAGLPLQLQYRRAFEYSDCWVDDARLVVLNARDAADRGAEIMTRSEVTGLTREGAVWRVAIERADGSRTEIAARAVVNAAGPRVEELLGRAGRGSAHHVRLVRGSHIVVPKLFGHDRAYFFQLADRRIFFAIPYESDFTLIGTTDADHDDPLDDLHASEAEIDYLCAGVNSFFRQSIGRGDVVWSYSGVRPLIDDGSGKPEAATRGYTLEIDAPDGQAPLLSVFGGKITTYRHLAESAVHRLRDFLPMLAGSDWTATAPLPGGDFAIGGIGELREQIASRFPFLGEATSWRIARAYGTRAFEWLGTASQVGDLGRDFGHGLSEAEVCYLRDREWARTTDDILWRRTKLGLRFDADQRKRLQDHISEKGERADAGADPRH